MWGTNERKEQRVLRLTELYKIAKSNEGESWTIKQFKAEQIFVFTVNLSSHYTHWPVKAGRNPRSIVNIAKIETGQTARAQDKTPKQTWLGAAHAGALKSAEQCWKVGRQSVYCVKNANYPFRPAPT